MYPIRQSWLLDSDWDAPRAKVPPRQQEGPLVCTTGTFFVLSHAIEQEIFDAQIVHNRVVESHGHRTCQIPPNKNIDSAYAAQERVNLATSNFFCAFDYLFQPS